MVRLAGFEPATTGAETWFVCLPYSYIVLHILLYMCLFNHFKKRLSTIVLHIFVQFFILLWKISGKKIYFHSILLNNWLNEKHVCNVQYFSYNSTSFSIPLFITILKVVMPFETFTSIFPFEFCSIIIFAIYNPIPLPSFWNFVVK